MKYPNVKVKLTGGDLEPLTILMTVSEALREALVPEDKIEQFREEATSGDYKAFIQTCMKWVDVT